MARYLYLDIETIPTADPAVIAEIEANITPPKTISKAETIAAWEAETKPQLVKDAAAKTALNGAFGSVCCIGWAWGDGDLSSVILDDERDTIDLAMGLMARGKPDGYEPIVIVGHNVAGFDIRYLWQRAMVLGIRMPSWFPRDPKPWSREVHDTMVMWAGARDFISLDALCRALRLPGKGNISGADVAGLWERQEYDAIAQYCREDVERVRAVHQKMLVAMGDVA